MNDLVVLEDINALEVFNGKGLDDLLGKITEEAKSIIPDLTTTKGRNEIKSMAAKVAKSKTYLDGLRKDLVSDWKTKAKAVDTEGKKMRDTLDALKEEVRRPLTDWENLEKERVQKLEDGLRKLTELGEEATNSWDEMTLDYMNSILSDASTIDIALFEEYAPQAATAKDKTVDQIKQAIEKREAYDKEQSELERLRTEAAEREQKDLEEKLRIEGEKRAKLEAERIAKEEKERVMLEAEKAETEKQNAINAKIEAENRAKLAEENAKIEAESAVLREQERVEAERIAEEVAAKTREANTTHKSKINNAVLEAFVLTGMNKIQAKKAVTALAQGKIPYTAISY